MLVAHCCRQSNVACTLTRCTLTHSTAPLLLYTLYYKRISYTDTLLCTIATVYLNGYSANIGYTAKSVTHRIC
jgi:hypothetical protein